MQTEFQYDYAVFIGRFQPLHNGHVAVINRALEVAKHVIVLVGSCNVARSFRNPFSFDERRDMVENQFSYETTRGRLSITPLNDHTYDLDGWLEEVQTKVKDIVLARNRGWMDKGLNTNLNAQRITLIGYNKDNTSYYLKLFPNWDSTNVEQTIVSSSTDIRKMYFTPEWSWRDDKNLVPVHVYNFLAKWRLTSYFADILAEHEYCAKYQIPFSVLPYQPTFNTVDAVIKCSGHVLLVTRRARPGKGLLALPGGFLEPTETLFNSCVREVEEETKIDTDIDFLPKHTIRNQNVFDDPYRDPRGRFITQAFYFDLGNRDTLPKVKGGSDASRAQWVPIANLRADNMFADHYFIIRKFLNA